MIPRHAWARDVWLAPRYEPVPRKFAGSRLPVYVPHRFPIKGGISLREVMLRQTAQPNALHRMLQKGT